MGSLDRSIRSHSQPQFFLFELQKKDQQSQSPILLDNYDCLIVDCRLMCYQLIVTWSLGPGCSLMPRHIKQPLSPSDSLSLAGKREGEMLSFSLLSVSSLSLSHTCSLPPFLPAGHLLLTISPYVLLSIFFYLIGIRQSLKYSGYQWSRSEKFQNWMNRDCDQILNMMRTVIVWSPCIHGGTRIRLDGSLQLVRVKLNKPL